MRIQVKLSSTTKQAAEAQAVLLGYPSLATMLRVVATGLARDYTVNPAAGQMSTATTASTAEATEAAVPPTTNLPTPESFTHWPAHISPDIQRTDHELYRFLIESGQIH